MRCDLCYVDIQGNTSSKLRSKRQILKIKPQFPILEKNWDHTPDHPQFHQLLNHLSHMVPGYLTRSNRKKRSANSNAKSNFINNVSNLLNNHLKHQKFAANSKIKMKLKHLDTLLENAAGNSNNAADTTNEKTIVSFLSNLLNDMEMEKDSEHQHRTVGIFIKKSPMCNVLYNFFP